MGIPFRAACRTTLPAYAAPGLTPRNRDINAIHTDDAPVAKNFLQMADMAGSDGDGYGFTTGCEV
jgi:hypothetical protein